MTFSDELVRRARALDRSAMRALLGEALPVVHRLARALSGREDVGRGIERFVMGRALHVLPQWRDGDAAAGWFYHHTVLTSRRAQHHPVEPQNDLLAGSPSDPAYMAFVRAVRSLPVQQREAFLLRHCEGLESRTLARSMDCSIQAAQLHLGAAEENLRLVVGERWQEMRARLQSVYGALQPQDEGTILVEKVVRRHLLPRKIRRVVLWVLLVSAAILGFYLYRAGFIRRQGP